MTPQHIAIVSFTRLGDLIQTVPFLCRLRNRHPSATVTLVVNAAFTDAAHRLPGVTNVVPFPWDALVPQLDGQRGNLAAAAQLLREFLGADDLSDIDEVYNLSHTKLSATLCHMLNARGVHGYARNRAGGLEIHGKWFSYLFSILEDRTYNPYNLVEIYSRFAEGESSAHGLGFHVSEADRQNAKELLAGNGIQSNKPLLALQPGASTENRQWPAERFGELAARMSERGWQSIVLGSAEEKPRADSVLLHSNGTAVSLAGQTTIGTLAAVLERAERLVSNDTGTIHVAAAVGTPCVGIYLGPASAKDTAPYGTGHFILEPDLACAPCHYRQPCACPSCALSIEVSDVIELLMTDEKSKHVASHAKHARVCRTEVLESGEFRLNLLNFPQTATLNDTTEFFRNFWDALLSGAARPPDVALPLGNTGDVVRAFERVNAICMSGRKALTRLQDAQRKASPSDINKLVTEQAHWQNLLRAEASCPSLLKPFLQYILVLLAVARVDSLSGYVCDLNDALLFLEKGMGLLKPRAMQPQAISARV